jgi:hypothetical protein
MNGNKNSNFHIFSEFAERRCSSEGKWENKPGTPESIRGWTNYTPCYFPEILELINKLGAEAEVSRWRWLFGLMDLVGMQEAAAAAAAAACFHFCADEIFMQTPLERARHHHIPPVRSIIIAMH